MKWTLQEGIDLINTIKPEIEKLGYSLGLTGSVLFRGNSSKDLDLILYPMENSSVDYTPPLCYIQGYLKASVTNIHQSNPDRKLVFILKTIEGRRVDVFIPSRTQADREDDFEDIAEIKYSKI